MMNYKLTCSDGFTKTVSAASRDEAVTMLLADADVTAHVSSTHPELAGKTPEEMTAMVSGMVSEEVAAAAGDADGGGMPTGGAPVGGAV